MGVLMMKKNGFISISIIYSFFVVFMLLLLLIMQTYVNNRFNFNIYKNDIRKKITDTYNPYQNSGLFKDYISSLVSTTSSQTGWKVVNENGIRYQGKTPDNYVNFNGEKWRIVGIFDNDTHGISGNLVKIVRNDPLTSSMAFTSSNVKWPSNSLATYLNGTYYNSLSDTSRNLIQSVYWKNGTSSKYATTTLANQYTAERNATGKLKNVGLIYPSDYGYAALSASCPRTTYTLANYDLCRSYDWLVISSLEWTMTQGYGNNWYAFTINPNGYIASTYGTTASYVRPSVYLKANVKLYSGSGTYDDPYTIAI